MTLLPKVVNDDMGTTFKPVTHVVETEVKIRSINEMDVVRA